MDYGRRYSALMFLGMGVLALASCAPYAPRPVRTQLQIREFQTRTYQRGNLSTIQAMKAVIDVLQDEGYLIRNADKDLGYVVASRENDVENRWDSAFSILSEGADARFAKNSVLESSVSVSEINSEIRIRAVFQSKIVDNQGGTLQVEQVEDPVFYQAFFSKIDKGIFIQQQRF